MQNVVARTGSDEDHDFKNNDSSENEVFAKATMVIPQLNKHMNGFTNTSMSIERM